jgi:hypothetical protein
VRGLRAGSWLGTLGREGAQPCPGRSRDVLCRDDGGKSLLKMSSRKDRTEAGRADVEERENECHRKGK